MNAWRIGASNAKIMAQAASSASASQKFGDQPDERQQRRR